MSEQRMRALAAARAWIGTPYRHQASAKGQGADCLGLVRGVWRALYGAEPDAVPPYLADWAERGAVESLLAASRRHLIEIQRDRAKPGDVALFRFTPACLVKHCAIVSAPDRMIHAWQGRAVCETAMGPWWRRRLAAAFQFPSQP